MKEAQHLRQMHTCKSVRLPPGLTQPLTVFIKRQGKGCNEFIRMGPRRRKQLITAIALFMFTLLGIQYSGHNNLGNEEVRLRFINPSLPNDRTQDEVLDLAAKYAEKKVVFHRGAGRHLQEETDGLLDAIVMRQSEQRHPNQRLSHVNRNFNILDKLRKYEAKDHSLDAENSVNSLGSHVTILPAHKIPLSFLNFHHCPACSGTSLCEEFAAGNVTAFQSLDGSPKGGQVPGSWNGRGVILRSPSEEQVESFTSFLCANWTKSGHSDSCDISQAIMQSELTRLDLDLSPHYLKQQIFPQDEDPLSIISPTTCSYGHFFTEVKDLHNIHHFRSSHRSSRMATLMSALLLDPMPPLLQFIEEEAPSLLPHFPKYLGTCGHVTVIEEEGLPLINFLPDPWEKRVDLAMEILRFIDNLWNASSKWAFLLLDFSYKNFVVLPDGRLQLITPEKILVIDKEYFHDVLKTEVNPDHFIVRPPCNKICLVTFLNQLILTNQTECSLSTNPKQFMYMMASHMLLSDLYTTRSVRLFSETDLIEENHPGGLLYDIPDNMDSKISQLLYECIIESQGGSRENAIKTIKRLLEIVKKGFDFKRKLAANKKRISVAQPG